EKYRPPDRGPAGRLAVGPLACGPGGRPGRAGGRGPGPASGPRNAAPPPGRDHPPGLKVSRPADRKTSEVFGDFGSFCRGRRRQRPVYRVGKVRLVSYKGGTGISTSRSPSPFLVQPQRGSENQPCTISPRDRF